MASGIGPKRSTPSQRPKEVGNTKVTNPIPKEKGKARAREKEKAKAKEKEKTTKARVKEKGPLGAAGSVKVPTTHRIALWAKPKAKESKQRMGSKRTVETGIFGGLKQNPK